MSDDNAAANFSSTSHHLHTAGVYSAILYPAWLDFCKLIRPLTTELGNAESVQVICGLTHFTTRYAMSVVKLGESGFDIESQALLRTVTELFVNHTYIFHSYPEGMGNLSDLKRDGLINDLCHQFVSYADLKYAKFVKAHPEAAKKAIKKHYGFTDEEFGAWCLRVNELQEKAKKKGCSSRSWNQKTLRDMTDCVKKNFPDIYPEIVKTKALSNDVVLNSAVHMDALGMRLQLNARSQDVLDIRLRTDTLSGDIASLLATCTWLGTAKYFNKFERMDKIIKDHLKEAFIRTNFQTEVE